MIIYQILFLVFTYLLSSVPFGLILTKTFASKDIRQFGSKNIGATNVTRIAGKKLGFATLILDGLKGATMVIAARFIFSDIKNLHLFLVLISATAVMGHIYPIYLNFKGGKGVATAIAVLFALDSTIGFLASCFWLLSFGLFRISAISSLIAIFSSAILSTYYSAPVAQIYLCWFLFIVILIRHRENLVQIFTDRKKQKM